MATIAKNVADSSNIQADTKSCGRTLKVTEAELEGIRAILDNPKPPSEKMAAGMGSLSAQRRRQPGHR